MLRVKPKPKVKRNYANERKYDAKPIVKKKRVLRNAARNKLIKAGAVKKYDGKDVHHVGGNALNPNSRLKAVSANKNRSYPRTKNAKKLYKTSQENEPMAMMKKKTKYMAKGGYGTPTKKMKMKAGGATKKTKYMARGGAGMKKTKYMAKGGAAKRK